MTDTINKLTIAAGIMILAASVMFLYWQFYLAPKPVIPPIQPPVVYFPSSFAYASLGENIYKRSRNPIVNKVPDAPAPNVNPIDGAYKNPFD
ncbi:hypothetical protein A2662_02955 [Candidatus Giovannonibacteria bacterium RIFCSPHIGHO2_01_FULL_45_33]|uniref:Uncharacterized protein n=1 Tax=Candidatus Giovannonibacteria bacterium RIFCSPLOWO2_01_FULL_45_34 TaxID=1798351 RepID=A0A1F5X1N7_9BACT|nr:MAG: hypothetical protein A2662_02955 [Candidatus Giovannonibacteria bacterium RIFCSPHIGHO2_01_FULL_45_33]OGF81806.1 MAG: hypothetical protein A2930_01425 [Candidatus Giovannonibacteria bacterium RIFCSPLOWO2_01_FULL_45_34]